MSWTKKQLITSALDELGITSYEFDISPEEYETALRRLDTMMASWNANGARLSFPLYSNPANSSLSEDSNLPDHAIIPVFKNLALELAPSYRRQPTRDLKASAMDGKEVVFMKATATAPIPRQLPGDLPSGAGNKGWREDHQNFIIPPADDQVAVGPDSLLGFD